MPVDVLLFSVRAGSRLGGHKHVSHLIGVDVGIVLVISLELTDKGVKSFRVVFGDIKFDSGSVKGKNLCQRRINVLADRFRIVNHLLKHEFNVAGKPQFEARKERGVGDLGKAAESSEFFTELQEENEQGIRRDREDFLQNESRKEASKRKIPFSSKVVIKGIEKIRLTYYNT